MAPFPIDPDRFRHQPFPRPIIVVNFDGMYRAIFFRQLSRIESGEEEEAKGEFATVVNEAVHARYRLHRTRWYRHTTTYTLTVGLGRVF